jgi:hypothetical protein
MSDDTTDWTELREFKAVDLGQSYVLSWRIEAGSLLIDVDLCLCTDHIFYEEPRPAERACYRPALIDFPHCESATDSPGVVRLTDSIRRLRPGKIKGLRRTGEGRYEITGEFGRVAILAERPMVRLKNL